MNILLLCDEYPPGRHGGIGTVVQLLAKQYVRMGHHVIVAGFYDRGYGGEDSFTDEGVLVYRYRQLLAFSLFEKQDTFVIRGLARVLNKTGISTADIKISLKKYGDFLNKLISEHRIEVVEMPDYNDYMRICNKAVFFPALNAPVVVKLHGCITYFNEEAGIPTPHYIRKMEKEILNNASGVISVSNYTGEKTARYLDYKGKIDVLYNGIEMPQLPATIHKMSARVVFTGSLVAKKGIYQLMKAWNTVIEKIPSAELYIYGKGPVDKIKSLLTKQAMPSVSFQGHVPREQLFRDLAEARLAVFPSYAETFGLGVIEAMACGTAVVFSTLTSGPEIVKDGITGRLINPDDIEGMSALMITLLSDNDLCSRLAENGQKDVSERFNISTIASQNISYYRNVIKKLH